MMSTTGKDQEIIHPILKQQQSHIPSNNQNKKLTWNEENITETSADRGTRMRITEPKTPYVHYDAVHDRILGSTNNDNNMQKSFGASSSNGANDFSVNLQSPTSSHLALDQQNQQPNSMRFSLLEQDSVSNELDARFRSREDVNVSFGEKVVDWTTDDEGGGDNDSLKHDPVAHAEFLQKRAQHYNMRDALRNRPFDDDDDRI